jgi:HEAT repeat protein
LKDPDQFVRRNAAGALGEIGPGAREAVPALVATLKEDGSSDVRGTAAGALGFLAPAASTSVPALLRALQDDRSGDVRSAAAFALGRLGPVTREVVPALTDALKDRTNYVREAAALALGEIGPKAEASAPALRKALTADSGRSRVQFAWALWAVTRSTDQVVTVLIDSLMEPNDVLSCEQGDTFLGKIGPKAHAAVPMLLFTLRSEESRIRRAATAALVSIDPQTAAKMKLR